MTSRRIDVTMKRRTISITAACMMASSFLVATTPAHASEDPSPFACPTKEYIDITGHTGYHMRGRGLPVFKDGPGGEVTGRVSLATSVAATISAGASVELGGVVAKAKTEISYSLTATIGVTVGHDYKHEINALKYGNMQYGAWGQKVTWRRLRDNANCTTTVLKSGWATIPSNAIGWKYWETSS